MLRRHPRSTRPDPPFPSTPLCRAEGIGVAEVALQFRPAFVAGTVHRDVAHALEEAVDARGIALARSDMTLDRLARRLPVFRIRHLPPRHRDDAAGTDDQIGRAHV